MSRTLRILAPAAAIALGLAFPAVAQERSTSTFRDTVGSCAPGDRLVVDFTIREQTAYYRDRQQLHLHLTGTITRTGTGVTGKYAETQLDKFGADGSERYSGTLSRLVVPGVGVFRAAGHAVFAADGDARFTPGLASLDDFESRVCELLG